MDCNFSNTAIDTSFLLGILREANENTCLKIDNYKCIQRVVDVLQRNYQTSDVHVWRISKELGMVERTLRRKSKDFFNMTPMQLLTTYRIHKGKKLLLEGNLVTEVAHATGFSSHSYFSRVFKLNEGISPQEFVRRNQNICPNIDSRDTNK